MLRTTRIVSFLGELILTRSSQTHVNINLWLILTTTIITSGFLTFSKSIEMKHKAKRGLKMNMELFFQHRCRILQDFIRTMKAFTKLFKVARINFRISYASIFHSAKLLLLTL